MACREWGSELTDWALDELPPAKVREVEQHIAQCQECARSAQRLLGVRQALKTSLIDREMPAHLVLVGEQPQGRFAGFWAGLLRTAALSAAAAAIFLAVTSVGLRYWLERSLPPEVWARPPLTQTELQAFVTKAVAEQASLQSKETQAASRDLVAGLREEETENWARIARQLQYLESAQNTEWKETQRQNEVIRLVARSQQLLTNPQGR
jgi:anti-sigma factor RsiW